MAQGQDQGEGRARAFLAAQADLPAEKSGQLPGDGQAQARASVPAAGAAVGLAEGLEDGALLVFGDADAHVRDRDAHRILGRGDALGQGRVRSGPEYGQGHAALLGELEGVGQEVAQDLLQAVRVGEHGLGQVRVPLDDEGHALFRGHALEDPLQVGHDGRERHLFQVQLDLARLDLGQVEDLVDQAQQVRPGGVDGRGGLLLLGGEVALLVVRQELGQDEDGVERGAQLVGHVGQKFRLVAAGALQFPGLELELLLGAQQLLVLAADGGLLVFELHGPFAQLVVDRAQLALLLLQAAFGLFEGPGLFGQFLVGDLQFLLLGLQFALGLLEHVGLLFELLVGHAQHFLLFLGLAQQFGDHAPGGGHVEEHGRVLGDVGDELAVQGRETVLAADEEGSEQLLAHDHGRGQEMGGHGFAGAEMKGRGPVVGAGEGQDFAFQGGLSDQALAHGQARELALPVGEGIGGGQHQLAVLVQEEKPQLAVHVLAQKGDEEPGELPGAVLPAQGVVEARLALVLPVHFAQVAGHAVQGPGQHAQFVPLAQVQAGLQVAGGDGLGEAHALLQGLADAPGQPVRARCDQEGQRRAGGADDDQEGPDGAQDLALVDLGDENPVGAEHVQGVEGHEHRGARAVPVGAAAPVEARGHGVVPVGRGARQGVADDVGAGAHRLDVAAQLELSLVFEPAQQIGFAGFAQSLARRHDLVDEFGRDAGGDDPGHRALQIQDRVADEGGLPACAGLVGAEVLEGHVPAAQHPLPESGQGRVPVAPRGQAGADLLALAGRVHDQPAPAVDEVEVLETVDPDVSLELGVVPAVNPLVFGRTHGIGQVGVLLPEQVQVRHGLLGLAQPGHEPEPADALGQGRLQFVALDGLDAAELVEGQVQQGVGGGIAADEGHDAQGNDSGHDEQEQELGLHADVVEDHGSSWRCVMGNGPWVADPGRGKIIACSYVKSPPRATHPARIPGSFADAKDRPGSGGVFADGALDSRSAARSFRPEREGFRMMSGDVSRRRRAGGFAGCTAGHGEAGRFRPAVVPAPRTGEPDYCTETSAPGRAAERT